MFQKEFGPEITDQLERWESYFERLATAENLPHFNEGHHKSSELNTVLVSVQNKPCKEPDLIDKAKFLKTLKASKAEHIYGLTSEHIKLAPPPTPLNLSA